MPRIESELGGALRSDGSNIIYDKIASNGDDFIFHQVNGSPFYRIQLAGSGSLDNYIAVDSRRGKIVLRRFKSDTESGNDLQKFKREVSEDQSWSYLVPKEMTRRDETIYVNYNNNNANQTSPVISKDGIGELRRRRFKLV